MDGIIGIQRVNEYKEAQVKYYIVIMDSFIDIVKEQYDKIKNVFTESGCEIKETKGLEEDGNVEWFYTDLIIEE